MIDTDSQNEDLRQAPVAIFAQKKLTQVRKRNAQTALFSIAKNVQ